MSRYIDSVEYSRSEGVIYVNYSGVNFSDVSNETRGATKDTGRLRMEIFSIKPDEHSEKGQSCLVSMEAEDIEDGPIDGKASDLIERFSGPKSTWEALAWVMEEFDQ